MRRLLGMALLIAAGCGTADVPHHPVQGLLTFPDGRPLTGGTVTLKSADATFTVSAPVQPDGRFELHTIKGNRKTPGAPAGDYAVTVVPPLNQDQSFVPLRVAPATVTIAPGENRLKFVVTPLPEA